MVSYGISHYLILRGDHNHWPATESLASTALRLGMKLPGTQNSDSCSERNPKEHHETYGNTLFLLQEMLNLGALPYQHKLRSRWLWVGNNGCLGNCRRPPKKRPLHWENHGKVHRSVGNPIYWAKPTVNVQRNWSAANHWEPGPSLATMWRPPATIAKLVHS